MILKIQRPLSGNNNALVYNRTKTQYALIPWEKVQEWFAQDELKVFVSGRIAEPDLVVYSKLKARDW